MKLKFSLILLLDFFLVDAIHGYGEYHKKTVMEQLIDKAFQAGVRFELENLRRYSVWRYENKGIEEWGKKRDEMERAITENRNGWNHSPCVQKCKNLGGVCLDHYVSNRKYLGTCKKINFKGYTKCKYCHRGKVAFKEREYLIGMHTARNRCSNYPSSCSQARGRCSSRSPGFGWYASTHHHCGGTRTCRCWQRGGIDYSKTDVVPDQKEYSFKDVRLIANKWLFDDNDGDFTDAINDLAKIYKSKPEMLEDWIELWKSNNVAFVRYIEHKYNLEDHKRHFMVNAFEDLLRQYREVFAVKKQSPYCLVPFCGFCEPTTRVLGNNREVTFCDSLHFGVNQSIPVTYWERIENPPNITVYNFIPETLSHFGNSIDDWKYWDHLEDRRKRSSSTTAEPCEKRPWNIKMAYGVCTKICGAPTEVCGGDGRCACLFGDSTSPDINKIKENPELLETQFKIQEHKKYTWEEWASTLLLTNKPYKLMRWIGNMYINGSISLDLAVKPVQLLLEYSDEFKTNFKTIIQLWGNVRHEELLTMQTDCGYSNCQWFVEIASERAAMKFLLEKYKQLFNERRECNGKADCVKQCVPNCGFCIPGDESPNCTPYPKVLGEQRNPNTSTKTFNMDCTWDTHRVWAEHICKGMCAGSDLQCRAGECYCSDELEEQRLKYQQFLEKKRSSPDALHKAKAAEFLRLAPYDMIKNVIDKYIHGWDGGYTLTQATDKLIGIQRSNPRAFVQVFDYWRKNHPDKVNKIIHGCGLDDCETVLEELEPQLALTYLIEQYAWVHRVQNECNRDPDCATTCPHNCGYCTVDGAYDCFADEPIVYNSLNPYGADCMSHEFVEKARKACTKTCNEEVVDCDGTNCYCQTASTYYSNDRTPFSINGQPSTKYFCLPLPGRKKKDVACHPERT